MHFTSNSATIVSEVRTFVMGERKSCVSDREWKFRLKGYGYDIRQTEPRHSPQHPAPRHPNLPAGRIISVQRFGLRVRAIASFHPE